MKIAILHNFMDNIGGAEKVTLTMGRELKGDIYSTNVNTEAIKKMGFKQQVRSIGKVPINAPFKQQFSLWRFRKVKFKKKYDCFIIDGDWAMSAAVKNKPNIWYVHSPIREIWDLYKHTRNNMVPKILRPLFDLWVMYNRRLNKKYLKNVDSLVCNSKNVQKRIKKFLKRDARVIYPPIDTQNYKYKKHKNYWLAVNRLIGHKNVELQLEAFKQMPEKKLIIVGSFEKSRHFINYRKKILKNKPKNVTIISHANDEELKKVYSECVGFITTANDEDFGMTPVEAMASGKPVVAPATGGYLETVIDKKTGILIKDINSNKLVKAIKQISKNPEKYKEACLKQAKKFDTKRFIKEIKKEVDKLTK